MEENKDLAGLDFFIKKMQDTLTTYEILLKEEETRGPSKGKPDPNVSYYEGCVHALQSLLYLSSDIKRRNDAKLAKLIAARNKENNHG